MANLSECSSREDVRNFLLFHMDSADDRKSKINPSLTKQQVWDINMGAALNGVSPVALSIMIKNLKREFGSYYEA